MIAGTPAAAAADSMIVLTLPDGSTREVPAGTLARDVVATIGARLLQASTSEIYGDPEQHPQQED